MASQVPEWILLQLFRANFAVLKLRSTEPSSAHNAGIPGLFGMTYSNSLRGGGFITTTIKSRYCKSSYGNGIGGGDGKRS